jgi:cytidylate kinase
VSASLFATRFEERLGPTRVAAIREAMTSRRVVLLAGDPGVGKSTVARELAARLGGAHGGSGACVREEASRRGLSLDAYNQMLREDPTEDVAMDALAAMKIARGDVVVFESRLAGHVGRWLRGLGREGLLSLYLRCDPVVQALRLVGREGSPGLRDEIAPGLEGCAAGSLDACVRRLRAQGGAAPEAEAIVARQAARMASDRERLFQLYGVTIDAPETFDEVFDTSSRSVAACVEALQGILCAWHHRRDDDATPTEPAVGDVIR